MHVLQVHGSVLQAFATPVLGRLSEEVLQWDLYTQAIAVRERRGIPCVGPSVDRRSMEHLVAVYKDHPIRSLICFACARIQVDTGRLRSKIEFFPASFLFQRLRGCLKKNFSMAEFEARYSRPGTPLAEHGATGMPCDRRE